MISLLYNDTKPLNIGGINMKCNNCGFEYEDSLRVCPNCESNSQLAVISLNPAADKVSAAITDGLFLVMCILMSASCIFGLLVGRIPTLNILFTIFMWLAYAQARKGILDSTHLRSLSGTTFAMYVINYVAAGLVALAGFMIAFVLSVLVQSFANLTLENVVLVSEAEDGVALEVAAAEVTVSNSAVQGLIKLTSGKLTTSSATQSEVTYTDPGKYVQI
jgi:hypothetical protein